MSTIGNLRNRLKDELEVLITNGQFLDASMKREVVGEKEFRKAAEKQFSGEKLENFISKIPDFRSDYETWYSKSLAVVKQLLPDRQSDFIALYKKASNRKETSYGNYVIQDFLESLRVTRAGDVIVDIRAALPKFAQQLAILRACKSNFDSALVNITQLAHADVLDGEIAAARELQKSKFYRAAGAVCGVAIERHLNQICKDHSIAASKKNPTINDLNQILKDNSIIDNIEWRHISLLADIRNLSVHNKQQEPTLEQITTLIDGTAKIIKTVF
jgi:hypothetical protein